MLIYNQNGLNIQLFLQQFVHFLGYFSRFNLKLLLFLIYISMSTLIDEKAFSQHKFSKQEFVRKQYFSTNQRYSAQNQCCRFYRQINLSGLKNMKTSNIAVLSSRQLEITFHINFRQTFGIITKIYIDFQSKVVAIEFSYIECDKLISLNKKSQRNMMNTIIQKINSFNISQNLTFLINPLNGLLLSKTQSCFLSGRQGSAILKNYIVQFIKSSQKLLIDQIHYIMDMIDGRFKKDKAQDNQDFLNLMINKANLITEAKDHLGLAHINLHQLPINDQEKSNTKKQIQRFMSNRTGLLINNNKQNYFSKQSYLFSLKLDQIYFLMSKLTSSIVQNQLTQSYKSFFNRFEAFKVIEGQNVYIYNSVMIKDEKNVTTKKIHNEGGFSRLQLAQLEIANSDQAQPVFFTDQRSKKIKQIRRQDKQNHNIYLKKLVAIKISKENLDYEKIKHEKIIVQKLKDVICPYLIKYYNATQPDFQYKQYLLMDYFGDLPNLSSYHESGKESMAFSSKIMIFMHLARALTVLQTKSIAHMDFTPHNIFMSSQGIPKIVDFGQSYHPCLQTKNKNYLPGYTIPYCPPQTFNKKKVFEPKSDVFSLGVIMFKILFQRFPFNHTKQLQKSYMNGTCMQKFYLSPQGLEDFYNNKISSLSLQLISHCMELDSKNRPYPFWIYVTLIKIFQLLG